MRPIPQRDRPAALRILATLTLSMTGAAAMAETATASLDISAIVPVTCSVSDLVVDLGTAAAAEKRQRMAASPVEVTCPIGTAYSISLADDGARQLQPTDKASGADPIPFTALLVGSDLATPATTLSRIGTGGPDRTMVQIKSILSGNELAGSYSQQLTLTIDW